MMWRSLCGLILLMGCPTIGHSETQSLELVLPTENDAIFKGDGPAFYQYIERDYKGVKSTPWEGGRYGFVRNPVETADGVVYTRLHEGIDIRPMHRDLRGDPTDIVHAIADGTVVHTNLVPGFSNYGKYIVVEHRWDGCAYYSLYGHLSSIRVSIGQHVHQSDELGLMGYTGEGLNQARAHLHLELNLMLSRQFDSWHRQSFPNEQNHHGLYNGINLMGLDIAQLCLALRKQPGLTIPQFLSREQTFYRVLLPSSKHFDLPKFYPWMSSTTLERPASWEVSFNRAGVPIKIEGSATPVSEPTLSYIKSTRADATYFTRDQVAGRGENAHLTENGKKLMRLLIFPD